MAAQFDLKNDGVVVIIGSGAGGGTLGNELAQKGIDVVILEAGARHEYEDFINDEWDSFAQLAWKDKRTTSGDWRVAKDFPNLPAWIVKSVGGSTTHWAGASLRFQEHGEMVMLGAYTTFVVQQVIRTSFPGLFDWSLVIALPLAFLVAALVGLAIERGVIRFLYGRPLETLLATWGVSLILQQAVRSIFGPTNQEVGNPSWMSGSFDIGQLAITWNRLWILVFALTVFGVLLYVMKRTPWGLQMRAVTANRRMVVVFGGVGNLWGTLVGAFSLGIVNKFLEPYAGAVLGKIVVLVLIILFIQKRPRGLFALKGRAVEACFWRRTRN